MALQVDNQNAKRRRLDLILVDAGILFAFLIVAFSVLWMPEISLMKFLLAGTVTGWSFAEARRVWAGGKKNIEIQPRGRGSTWLALFTLAAVAAMYFAGVAIGAYRSDPQDAIFDKSMIQWIGTKVPAVVGQQLFLNLLLMPLLIRVVQNVSASVFIGAAIFSALHMPNPLLMLLTLVGGTVWITSYHQSRRLLPLIASHLILAVFAAAFGGEYLLNMRVGKSCLELIPTSMQSRSGPVWQFPCSTVGCAERMIQTDECLLVEGWTYDATHAQPPRAFALRCGPELSVIENVTFDLARSSEFSQAANSGFVSDHCHAFTAKIPLSMLSEHVSFELFVANQNGNWSRLGKLGELKMDRLAAVSPVVIFPVEVDGRIEALRQQMAGVSVVGWAANLQKNDTAKRIVVQTSSLIQSIEIDASQRLKRPEIVAAYSQPAFARCGFELEIPGMKSRQFEDLRFYIEDDLGQFHPLKFTPVAQREIQRLASPNDPRTGKIYR